MAAKRNIVFTLKRGSDVLEIGSGKIYGLLNYSGLEASDYLLTMQPYAQIDGSRMAGVHVEPRRITLTAESVSLFDATLTRSTVLRFFDPKQKGTLTVTIGTTQRTIDYYVESFRFDHRSMFLPVRFTVSLLCPSPYWRGETFTANLAGVTALTGFPLVFHSSYRPTMSYRTIAREAPVTNRGDKPVGVYAIIVAKRGEASNPMLENLSTGEKMRVIVDMEQGDRLIINTTPGQKTITLNGENINHRIDRISTFFQMQQGVNVIRYDADYGYESLDVYPRFTAEYLGV